MQILRLVPGPAECRTCRHFEPASGPDRPGECRVGRPAIIGDSLVGAWPLVGADDRCGEHDRQLVPATESISA